MDFENRPRKPRFRGLFSDNILIRFGSGKPAFAHNIRAVIEYLKYGKENC